MFLEQAFEMYVEQHLEGGECGEEVYKSLKNQEEKKIEHELLKLSRHDRNVAI